MKKSSLSPSQVWYLEVLSAGANEKIADVLGSDITAEQKQLECHDGTPRDLWEVNYGVVERAINSLDSQEFNVFCSRDGKKPPEKIEAKTLKRKV